MTTDERLDRIEQLLVQRFDQHDQRFEQIDQRFSQIDQRFSQIDLRFDQIDQRFDQIDQRFSQIDLRFDQIDQRFSQIDLRFDRVDASIQSLNHRVDRLEHYTLELRSEMINRIQTLQAAQDVFRSVAETLLGKLSLLDKVMMDATGFATQIASLQWQQKDLSFELGQRMAKFEDSIAKRLPPAA